MIFSTTKLQFVFLLLGLGLFLSSCGDDDEDSDPQPKTNFISAEVEGSAFNGSAFTTSLGNTNATSAVQGNQSFPSISISFPSDVSTGTYFDDTTSSGLSSSVSFTYTDKDTLSYTPIRGDFVLEFTDASDGGPYEGNFNGKVYNISNADTISITNGSFDIRP